MDQRVARFYSAPSGSLHNRGSNANQIVEIADHRLTAQSANGNVRIKLSAMGSKHLCHAGLFI